MVPALDAFLFHLRLERNLSVHTVEAYSRDLNRFLDHVGKMHQRNSIATMWNVL